MRSLQGPAGYTVLQVGRATALVREGLQGDAEALLAGGSLHAQAARVPGARALVGRDVAYAISLPVSGERVVVRHNRHGGLLARATGDRFLWPSRGPRELEIAGRLRAMGIPTPAVEIVAITAAGPLLVRCDVATAEVAHARDLSALLISDALVDQRTAAWPAVRVLLESLAAQGVRHHDLNVKNILIADGAGGPQAVLLDVDRVTFHSAGTAHVARRNCARLLRSLAKWRDLRGANVDLDAVGRLLG